ncbi:MAG: DNA polymerase [Geminicoccaceae bacterium]
MTHLLMEFDKSGAEWVVVAYLSGDENMLDVVQNGKDPHLITGSLISGAPEEMVVQESKVVGLRTDPTTVAEQRLKIAPLKGCNWFLPRTMSIRQAAKKANHGLNYDEGYRTFALMNEIEEGEAKRIRESYLYIAYPGIPRWHEATRRQLKENNRTLHNLMGRKVRLLNAWGGDLFRQAYAFVPQSTVFDVTREGLFALAEDPQLRPMQGLAQVHDSILVQVPITAGWREIAEMSVLFGLRHMCPELEVSGRRFVIGTDLKVGLNWGNMHEIPLVHDVDQLAETLERAWDQLNE